MSGAPGLWIPGQGVQRTRTPEELPWQVMLRTMEYATIAQQFGLGLHCSRCSQDIVAKNAETDPVLKMRCGCRELWSVNPKAGKIQ
jgi:hypothetical protein